MNASEATSKLTDAEIIEDVHALVKSLHGECYFVSVRQVDGGLGNGWSLHATGPHGDTNNFWVEREDKKLIVAYRRFHTSLLKKLDQRAMNMLGVLRSRGVL